MQGMRMQDRRVQERSKAGKKGFRRGEMQERRDAVEERCSRGSIHERRDAKEERCRKGCGYGGMREMRYAGKE